MWLDSDGYPTNEALKKLSSWTRLDMEGALDFAKELWCWPDYVMKEDNEYSFMTGGHSGNEAIISALNKNVSLHATCWMRSERGGKHVYKVPSQAFKLAQSALEDTL